MSRYVSLDRTAAPGVATIVIDRPKVNAINTEILDQLIDVCAELVDDDTVRAVVVTGAGKNFAAGADITDFPSFDRAAALAFSRRFNEAGRAIETLPQITIAAVNGYALGGGLEIALATEFRVAADNARMGQPEIQLGIIPGGGGTQRLSRLVGITRAKELVYTGRSVEADEALTIGLVSAVHPAESLLDEAVTLASSYAAGPASLRIAKRVMMDGLHLPLAEAVEVEAQGFADSFTTDDHDIGVASFLEHGPGRATFTGR